MNEYQDQFSGSPIKTVYIQAEDETTFWIVCEVLADHKYTTDDCMVFNARIDGKRMSGVVSTKRHPKKENRGVQRDGFLEPFQFAKIASGTLLLILKNGIGL